MTVKTVTARFEFDKIGMRLFGRLPFLIYNMCTAFRLLSAFELFEFFQFERLSLVLLRIVAGQLMKFRHMGTAVWLSGAVGQIGGVRIGRSAAAALAGGRRLGFATVVVVAGGKVFG